MTPIDGLAEVVGATTPGPWKLHETGAIRTEQPTESGIPGVDEYFKDHKRWCAFVGDKVGNGRSIAMLRNLAEPMIEVLRAARSVLSEEGVKEHLSAYVMGVEFIERLDCLEKAVGEELG